MGAEDEFGPGCAGAVQFDGRPVNFCLKEPTTIQYLDPAFVSHNSAAEALLGKAFDAGVHPLPESIDSVVLSSWMAHHRDHPGRDADMLSGILGKM